MCDIDLENDERRKCFICANWCHEEQGRRCDTCDEWYCQACHDDEEHKKLHALKQIEELGQPKVEIPAIADPDQPLTRAQQALVLSLKASELRYNASMSNAMEMRLIAALQQREADAMDAGAAALSERANRPKVICLCGSTRFIEQFAVKTWELELEGHIVLGCTLLPSWYCPVRHHFAEHQGVKPQRDQHHLQKIDMADEVLILNYDGYVGESTRNEIAYARSKGKVVNYVEPAPAATEAP